MAKSHKMSKPTKSSSPKKKEDVPVWEGHYGTVQEMVVKDHNDKHVIAQDGEGYYATEKSYVGSGLLDPNRMYKGKYQDIEGAAATLDD